MIVTLGFFIEASSKDILSKEYLKLKTYMAQFIIPLMLSKLLLRIFISNFLAQVMVTEIK